MSIRGNLMMKNALLRNKLQGARLKVSSFGKAGLFSSKVSAMRYRTGSIRQRIGR